MDRWFDNLSPRSVKVRPGVRGLFSKDDPNRGSAQNSSQIVVKPGHHRREAEGGRVVLSVRL